MIIQVLIDCNNASFAENPQEAATILEEIAKKYFQNGVVADIERRILDTNGNFCGVVRVESGRLSGLKPDIHARNGRSSIS